MLEFTREYEDIGVHAPVWQNVRALVEKETEGAALGTINVVNDIPDGVEVFADSLVAKVFHNLIDNAIRHGGKTTTIHFLVDENEGARAIICEDDGVGIPSNRTGKLFTHGGGKGHGFGLFLSHEILAITGMTITEKGKPGRGAKFIINVPAEGYRVMN